MLNTSSTAGAGGVEICLRIHADQNAVSIVDVAGKEDCLSTEGNTENGGAVVLFTGFTHTARVAEIELITTVGGV